MDVFQTMTAAQWVWVIVFAAIAAVAAIVAVRMGYEKQLADVIYRMVCAAEDSIRGTKRGQERKKQVLVWVHELVPAPLQLFITQSMIENLIEAGVDRMKEELARRADIAKETDSDAGAGGAEVNGDETR